MAAVVSSPPLDAIIIPSARKCSISSFIELAREVNAPLFILSSRDSSAYEISERYSGVYSKLFVIDVTMYKSSLLTFATSGVEQALFGRTTNDIALKRNIGLLLCWLTGWQKIFFLDDDITGLNGTELKRIAEILAQKRAVGLSVKAFPDNSVVRHANRLAGNRQGVWLTGSALAVSREAVGASFFPSIYNEDWFFLMAGTTQEQIALTGEVSQKPYDPFNVKRAVSEEFGDLLAEGLLVNRKADGVDESNEEYWQTCIKRRQQLVGSLIEDLSVHRAIKQREAVCALQAAQSRLAEITPAQCTEYVRAWRHDVSGWRQRVRSLPCSLSIAESIDFLRLNHVGATRLRSSILRSRDTPIKTIWPQSI